MNITRDTEFETYLIDWIKNRESKEREGTHQSDLLFCLNESAMRRLKPTEPSTADLLRWGRGYATQRWLTGSLEDEPEIEIDGIKVTPDALYQDAPWELKDTSQSSTKPIEDNVYWIRQCMNQAYVLGKTEARLSRLEEMGNWKWVYRPKNPEKIAALVAEFGENWDEHPTLSAWHMTFTQDELNRHWAWMRSRKEEFERVLSTGVLMPKPHALASGTEWKCKWCKYTEECDRGYV
uniref:PD-(D/E)XK nuclease superfamily protein n=1 Tax=viral metagenome TaxID=1070528 RepID=A0A6M3L3G6_9ZZZZ